MTAIATIDAADPAEDDIRRARRLWAESAATQAEPERLALARELRLIGRPDQALKVAESTAAPTPAMRAEIVAALAALRETRRALEECAALRQAGHGDVVPAELERKLMALAGHPVESGGRAVIAVARIVAALAFGLARLLGGRRTVRFTSMAKFTRLADLVDRLDPLLRRLRAEHGADGFTLIVFFFGGYPNSQLMAMYGRQCRFVHATGKTSGRLARLFIRLLTLAGRHTEITTDYRRNKDAFLQHPPAIAFRPEEARRGDEGLAAIGIDPARPIVVFGLRDMAYYRFYGDVMNIPLTKQGRRAETHHRCPPLATYVEAAKFWAARGHQVVRMGLRVSEALPPGLDPLIVDYANGPRSDELDAWLFAKCRFLIAGDTGLFSGACAFDRPSVLSDLFLIRNTMYSSNKQTPNLFVPKLIRDERSGRLLSFREQIYFSDRFSYAEDCEVTGYSIVHNTADDLVEATAELAARLDGTHVAEPGDEELQQAYRRIYPPAYIGYESTGRIAAGFLRKHASLLD